MVWSGGCDGVLTPHATVFASNDETGPEDSARLAMGTAMSAPILPEDIGPPALVERNQIVTLAYDRAGLSIRVEGRSLARAGVGETVRVMNLSSRSTLSGRVQADGTVLVSP